MQPGISTLVFLSQRLHPGLLDALKNSGAATIEIYAARHHFDYTDRTQLREIALWFRDNGINATLHQPIHTREQEENWSRHVSATLSLIAPEKTHRIDAMDEVKRSLEAAEMIPVSAITLHLGLKDDPWDTRAIENSLTAIEHLKAFAHPLGVKVLLENLQNEVTTPEHLLEILRIGHFDNVGIALDIGHAHLATLATPGSGIDHAFEMLRPRIRQLNLHDNHGMRDEHLWPGSGEIDFANVHKLAASLPNDVPGILEIAHDLNETAASAQTKATSFFDQQKRDAEQIPSL